MKVESMSFRVAGVPDKNKQESQQLQSKPVFVEEIPDKNKQESQQLKSKPVFVEEIPDKNKQGSQLQSKPVFVEKKSEKTSAVIQKPVDTTHLADQEWQIYKCERRINKVGLTSSVST